MVRYLRIYGKAVFFVRNLEGWVNARPTPKRHLLVHRR